MSVLVKDMRFPNYCSDCEFSKPWGNSGTYCSRYPWKDDVRKVVCLDDIDNAPAIIETEG